MNTSIMFNPKALQAEMFYAFSHGRFIKGAIIVPNVSPDKLFWQVCEYYPSDKKSEVGKCVFVYEICRYTHVELRSSDLHDYTSFFIKEFKRLETSAEYGFKDPGYVKQSYAEAVQQILDIREEYQIPLGDCSFSPTEKAVAVVNG